MLEGITILELGGVIAGNFGSVILADLGAEIIKIEPKSGDTARNPNIAPYEDHSAIHLFMNRGKKSVVLDLKTDEGLDIIRRLVEQADVVIDNFRPGVMARLGIDHDALKALNPKIITVTVTGFGETGPLKDKAAFDLVVQAYSGHMSITGEPGGPPARVGAPLADMSGAIYGCISILSALVGRELHGTGHHVDVAMLDSMVHLLVLRRARLSDRRQQTIGTRFGPCAHGAVAGIPGLGRPCRCCRSRREVLAEPVRRDRPRGSQDRRADDQQCRPSRDIGIGWFPSWKLRSGRRPKQSGW